MGQTALVTGASSGIGRETAIGLAQKRYRVIAIARRMGRLKELADQFPAITPKQVDLSDPKDTATFCRYVAELPEPLSVLVNNAGYSIRGVLEDVSIDAIRRIFEVNVLSLIQVTQACLPGMRGLRKGTIVNLSSVVGRFTFPGSGVYAATKFAVEAISDSLRMELAPFGIRVVTIRPGPIATEFNDVAGEHSGDLMARTSPDYKSLYGAAGAATGKLFAELTVPGPDLIANLILEAVLSDSPKAAYAAGPFSEDLLVKRGELDDDAFHRLMLEKFGLADLQA
jgi:NADP-dependent 3-hydroxy acid dehydrogenase YdfG